ncbi:MAG: efflux transporter periplasmic adaptor subunit [Ignavibacteriae bacterium]|nr:MAG: efflux transporter periplasmic adaptor subunit [Ignavibacteriota bacterium]
MAKGKSKKSKKKLFVFGGLGLLLLIVIALILFSGDKEKIVSVDTEKVEKRNIVQLVAANGKIEPVEKVELRPEVTGEIVELPVKEGEKVKKGQLLIRLKPDQYIARKNKAKANLTFSKASLAQSEASLEEIEAHYKRVNELFAKELASQSELETANSSYLRAKSQVEAQKASVLQAEENYKDAIVELDKTAIYAPLDGTISQLNVEKSERVLGSSFSQGTHLMTVADLNKMQAIVEVDENDVVLISLGDTASVEIDAIPDKKFNALVTQIGNSANIIGSGTQNEVVNFNVEIELIDKDNRIRPGMSCDADIRTAKRENVLSVPIQSVTARMPENTKDGQRKREKKKKVKPKEVVFVEKGNLAVMKKVKTGISDDSYMEIESGLEEGEMIISGPYKVISKELSDSTKVRVNKDSNKRNK